MEQRYDFAPLRITLLGGLALGIVCVGIAVVQYPASTQQEVLYALALVLLVACGVVVVRGTWSATLAGATALRLGTLFGLLIGACWVVELYAANLAGTSAGWVLPVYRGSTFMAGVVFPLAAGIVAAARTERSGTGAAVGFWSGLIGGLITFLALMGMTYVFMSNFQQDPQNVRSYLESGERTLSAFIVGDSLFASCSHLLLIGMLWGSVLGAVGGAIGLSLARARKPVLRPEEQAP